jgi:hypothetical protein
MRPKGNCKMMPNSLDVAGDVSRIGRDVVFISKATPEDDEFVLWLAPRLEAAGYKVFADILTLEPGDRWRRQITDTLQNKAAKMLLCCRDATLNKIGVQEEIGIASDLLKELKDPRFIIPLRLEPFKKLFGIGELQWVDFLGSWAGGLHDLLDTLEKQNVPRTPGKGAINPNWENYRRRLAIKVEKAPEVLTSNWLRVASLPDTIRYYYPPGPINARFPPRSTSAVSSLSHLRRKSNATSSISRRLRSTPSMDCFISSGKAVNHRI